jgi:hypothetical protein
VRRSPAVCLLEGRGQARGSPVPQAANGYANTREKGKSTKPKPLMAAR